MFALRSQFRMRSQIVDCFGFWECVLCGFSSVVTTSPIQQITSNAIDELRDCYEFLYIIVDVYNCLCVVLLHSLCVSSATEQNKQHYRLIYPKSIREIYMFLCLLVLVKYANRYQWYTGKCVLYWVWVKRKPHDKQVHWKSKHKTFKRRRKNNRVYKCIILNLKLLDLLIGQRVVWLTKHWLTMIYLQQ